MRTGKQVFNYYKYAVIWAEKILAEDSRYSLSKAYEIDTVFGQLVESRLTTLRERLESSKRLSRLLWIAASKQWAQQTISWVASRNKDIDLMLDDYKNLSTADFLHKYPELDVGDEEDLAIAIKQVEDKFIDQMQQKFIEALRKVRHAVELLTGVEDD